MNMAAISAESAKLREQVSLFMTALAVPVQTPSGTEPVRRADGVLEFYKHWQVRGEAADRGLFATYSDIDDVIEFGLSDRDGADVVNVLHASLVVDGGELSVVSEQRSDLNLDAVITPESGQPLVDALRYFAEVMQGGAL